MKYAFKTHQNSWNTHAIHLCVLTSWIRIIRKKNGVKKRINTHTCFDAFLMEKRRICMDGAQTGKRQCHVTGNWKGDYPWGLQACWSRIIDLVHHLCHLWVGARCFWVGRVLFVSLKFWMQSEDAQAIFVGASETNEAGSSWRHSFHFAQKENCRQ